MKEVGDTNQNGLRLAVIASAAGIAVFALIVLLAPFLRESLFDRLFPKDPSDAFIPDDDSRWEECNGWATDPQYDKFACRAKALDRALTHNFYKLGLPLPPSGIKDKENGSFSTAATAGDDRAWYNWGGIDGVRPNGNTVNFLSEGTQCGIGPSICVEPLPTQTNTPIPTPEPSPTSPPEPTISRSPTPTQANTPIPTPEPSLTPPPTEVVTPSTVVTPSPIVTLIIPTPTATPIPNMACLGNRVILDTVRNDMQDAGENGVAGVKTTLYSSSDIPLAYAVTDAQGYYEFCSLEEGSYSVVFEKPDAYSFAKKAVGNAAIDSDADPSSGKTDAVSLAVGQNRDDIDAILYPVCSSIGDYVFFDENKNGVQDRDESGIANITVTLHAQNGQVIATAATDSNGYYDFGCIDAGDYYINFSLPEGYAFSPQNNGNDDNLDCDVNPLNGNTNTINLGQDEIQDTWDACIYVLGADTSKPLPNTGTTEITLLILALAGGFAVTGKFLIFGKKNTN